MSHKILAIIAEPTTVPACLEAAEAAASRLTNATVEALHVMVDPQSIISADEEVAFQQLRERFEGTAKERAEHTREAFDRWVGAHPEAKVKPEWKEMIGGEEDNVADEACRFDVLTLALPTNLDASDALHAAFFRCAKPMFVVPARWSPKNDRFADRVVVAWNDTAQCKRALDGVIPWLRDARSVSILTINGSEGVSRSAEDVLRRNDIPFTVHSCSRSPDVSLGDQIIEKAHEMGADLLVMGAYRHGQFIEWIMGGTTRHVLAAADLPLFMAH